MPSPADDTQDNSSPQGGINIQQHIRQAQNTEGLQKRGRKAAKNDKKGRDKQGERLTRIYPRELTKSPPAPAAQYTSPASPTLPPGYNPAASPLLSALGATNNTSDQYTSEWTKSLPAFIDQRPTGNGNGISIANSPPNYPPSVAADGGFNNAPMSTSPPFSRDRPLSHPNHYPSFGGRFQSPPYQPKDRRSSMYSNYGRRPSFANQPPLPHQPQPHFYGFPDLDFGLPAAHPTDDGLKPGENGYFCGFDTLATSGDGPSLSAEDVLLVGYQGGLEVCRVNRDRLDILGQLNGLQGGVIGAKIIPWTGRTDPHEGQRPLVALTIHGPVVPEPRDLDAASTAVTDDVRSDIHTRPPSRGADGPRQITHYQTSVQVFSLRTQEHLATLYTSPSVPVVESPASPVFQPPDPVGDIKIDANGKYVVVACGSNGEVFIFTQASRWGSGTKEGFHCVGKVWTTVHYPERRRSASASGSSETSSQSGEAPPQRGIPLFSLSPRTLAVVPPASSPHFSLNGTALLSQSNLKPPGITTHAAPPPPSMTCLTDMPEGDGLLNRVAREMTQEFLRGAQWLGVQGMQAWKNYWNKDAQSPRANGANYMHDPAAQYFPPTHGHASPPSGQSTSEPVLISIFDLQRLVDAEDTRLRNALNPLATFQAPLGISHLSFAPSGLSMLTASKKGDFYFVWDLMRMNHGKPAPSGNASSISPCVRQVHAVSRMTVANVIDVIWTAPKGEKLAILTEKGTIHVYEIPASAFHWPPPRRVARPEAIGKPSEAEKAPEQSTTRFGAMTSAMKSINGKTQPFLNAVRQRSKSGEASNYSALGGLAMAGANSGKGAVTAGFSKSLGVATNSMNQLYHKDDNKLRLHDTSSGVFTGRIRWLSGKGRGSMAVVAGGLLRIHSVTQTISHRRGKTNVSRALVSKKKDLEYTLQRIPDTILPPVTQAQLEGKGDVSGPRVEGYWTLRAIQRPTSHSRASNVHPLSFAELETNAPYQPFHTDRRISLHAYTESAAPVQNEWDLPLPTSDPHHIDDDEPWVFGGEILTTRVIGAGPRLEENAGGVDDLLGIGATGGMENLTLREGEPGEEVVVTTRRRRVKKGTQAEDEEGFFEDDCEVLDFAADRV